MQTTITYNGVLIKDVLTDGIDAVAQKDSTGVDQVGVRYVCNFSGVVHTADNDHTGKQVGSIQTGLYAVLQALTKDRRRFQLKIGGSTIIDVGPGAIEPGAATANLVTKLDNMDIANGPIPHLQVTKITGGVSATVRFTVEFTIPNCGVATRAANNSGLVNFRFWIAEDVDCQTWLTTRTYQGRIRVAHKNISPHALARVVTIPPLEDGFQRRVVAWRESEDGLHLDFTFQDVEQIAAAPWNRFANVGAISWAGQLTASTESMGATGRLSLNLSLTGPKGTSKADLIEIGFLVCQSKVKLIEAIQGIARNRASSFLESLSASEDLKENTISINCEIRHTGDSNLIAGLLSLGSQQVLGRAMGDLGIGYDPEISFNPGPSAGVGGIFLSILQTPCTPAAMPRAIVERPKKYQGQRNSERGTTQSTTTFEASRSNASNSHLSAIYLEYAMDSDFMISSGAIALPTGAAKNSQAPTLAIVNLHLPTCLREIRIDASRLDAVPELPDISRAFRDANGIIHSPVGDPHIIASVPQLSADSRNFLHRVRMQVTYAMSRPPRLGETLPVGSLPYRTSSLSDPRRVLPANTFVAPESILR